MANSLGESAQNDITDNPLGTLKGKSHEYGGELLRCLAKTVQDLAGPAGPLQMLTSTVRNLQNDMQDIKRKNEDERRNLGRKQELTRNDADETSGSEVGIENSMTVASEETAESDNQDIFEDLAKYFELQTEIGIKVNDKLAKFNRQSFTQGPRRRKTKEHCKQVQKARKCA